MFTKEFWISAGERAVRAFASSVLSVVVVGDKVLNLFSLDLAQLGQIGLGASVVSLLTSIVAAQPWTPGPADTTGFVATDGAPKNEG